jgi:hypothetical protein
MRIVVAALCALMLVTGVAEAKTHLPKIKNPPTQAQLDSFYATCIKVAPAASVLCKCKETAAPKLVESSFMDIIISSMKGKPLDAKYYDAYNIYIANSNAICKPEYM